MPEPHDDDPMLVIESLRHTIEMQSSRIAELEAVLAREANRNDTLQRTITNMRTSSASLLSTCEQAQESISNRLIREISRLKAEQLAMCHDVEAQEARLVDVLEQRLRTLQAEKCEIENAMEREQERIVNKLQRQIEELLSVSRVVGSAEQSNSPTSPLDLNEQVALATAYHVEREAELHLQIAKLQEENQNLIVDNIRLQNKLRRRSIEESPLIEPINISPLSLRRSDSISSAGGNNGRGKSAGSFTDLHISSRKSVNSQASDAEANNSTGNNPVIITPSSP